MERTHLKRWLRDNQWLLVGAAVLFVLALGIWGYWGTVEPKDQPFLSALYSSLLMFWMNGLGQAALPATIARLLAVAIVVYAGSRVVLHAAADGLDRFRAGRLRGHIVICGLGAIGLEAVKEFAGDSRWKGIVVLDRQKDDVSVDGARQRGARVVFGDATNPDDLHRAGVEHAAYVLVAVGSDDVASQIAAAVEKLLASTGRTAREPLICSVHLSDYETFALMRRHALQTLDGSVCRIDYFNVWEASARALVAEYPVHSAPDGRVLVVGTRAVALALVTHLARTGAFSRLVVVGSAAAPLLENAKVYARWDGDSRASIVAFDSALDATLVSTLAKAVPDWQPDMVYVCGDDDESMTRSALALSGWAAIQGVPVVAVSFAESGMLGGRGEVGHRIGYDSLAAFACLPSLVRPEEVLWGRLVEELARAEHARYVEREEAAGHTLAMNPSMADFDDLAPVLQESSRAQVEDIWNKLATVGMTVEPTMCAEPGREDASFSDAEVEALARREHERWMRERRAAGWVYAAGPKNPTADPPTSPYLVDYDQLDKDIQELDGNAVRDIPVLLARIGYRLVRKHPGIGEAG